MSDLVGRRLGSYDLLDVRRRGRTSTTYHGVDGGRAVTVTVFEPIDDRAATEALLAEALAVAGLRHPNIAVIEFAAEQDGQVYLVEEAHTRHTLRDLRSTTLDPAGAVGLLAPVLAGLGHAHESGVVHRNVTTGHVAIEAPFRPVLTDFAIGRELYVAGSGGSASRMVLGTPAYLAPEQAFGLPAEPRTDLYSVGVVLFELLTGRVPFESDDPVAVLRGHASEEPPSLRQLRPDLPPALDDAVLRALAKDPDGRQRSAADLAAELSDAVSEPPAAPPRRQGEPAPPAAVDPSHDPLAADYAAGVRAFSQGLWAEAIRLLTPVADADLDYEDVEDLLRAAVEAQGSDGERA
jgi:serine/threonine protein kinase